MSATWTPKPGDPRPTTGAIPKQMIPAQIIPGSTGTSGSIIWTKKDGT